jgi:hypothetical protein
MCDTGKLAYAGDSKTVVDSRNIAAHMHDCYKHDMDMYHSMLYLELHSQTKATWLKRLTESCTCVYLH